MPTTLSLPASPDESLGLSFEYKTMPAGETIQTIETPVVETLRGTRALTVNTPAPASDNRSATLQITLPAGTRGSRWRVTVNVTTSVGNVFSNSVLVQAV